MFTVLRWMQWRFCPLHRGPRAAPDSEFFAALASRLAVHPAGRSAPEEIP